AASQACAAVYDELTPVTSDSATPRPGRAVVAARRQAAQALPTTRRHPPASQHPPTPPSLEVALGLQPHRPVPPAVAPGQAAPATGRDWRLADRPADHFPLATSVRRRALEDGPAPQSAQHR